MLGHSQYVMPFGAEMRSGATARFALWAPQQGHVDVRFDEETRSLPMQREADGWHRLITGARAGSRYRFVLSDGLEVPDPASRYQPKDVHGPSELIDPAAYVWRDRGWRGRPWHEAILYELHIGSFTAAGTFCGAIERLEHLAALGVTALELMPVADFPGKRNWGYDGVLPFAPDASYGRPEDLKALVDAAHALGLMVILDVVYNHFGPEGNYLPRYAPEFFHPRHRTPWGAAINFDAAGSGTVREFFVHNALYWLHEFHLDGLRLDAVHAIVDDSPVHILTELAQRVRGAALPRAVHLVLENERNQVRWLERAKDGQALRYEAQWNDDAHHALHVAASGEGDGYYAEYLGDTERLGRALAQGFAFQGELMRYAGKCRGEPSAHLPPAAFIAFIQNHDQVGNRAFGERLCEIAQAGAAVCAVSALYLLLPQIPLLFMGEEWGSRSPFPFFCDFGPELAAAVRQGRRQEFARFAAFADARQLERIPDPQAESTFDSSKLDWNRVDESAPQAALRRYRELLAIRSRYIAPLLPKLARGGDYRVLGRGALMVRWRADAHAELTLIANLSSHSALGFPVGRGHTLWQEGSIDEGALSAWALRWTLNA
jgi:malto-oligosyltrehalose trehalohydrolase